MTMQVLVFKTGMMGEYSTVAAFSADEVSRAIAFWEDNPSDYITCDVWEGDKEVETLYDLGDLMKKYTVAANPRRRSSKKRASKRKR